MRYDKLLQLIDIFQPSSIVEIGTWNGDNAVRMITAAQKYSNVVGYIGYDLFEDATAEINEKEFNVKYPANYDVVQEKLWDTGAQIALIKGDTNKTLNPVMADFAFIDGGHSVETIRNDYEKLKHSSVIVFDDYYSPDVNGAMPDINQVGCNRIVEALPHAVIETTDKVAGGGYVNLAVVFGE